MVGVIRQTQQRGWISGSREDMRFENALPRKLSLEILILATLFSFCFLPPQTVQAATLATIDGVSGQCIRNAGILNTDKPEKYMVLNQDAYDRSDYLAVCSPGDKEILKDKIVPLSEDIKGELEKIREKSDVCGWLNMSKCFTDFRDWMVTSIGFIFAAIGGFALLLSGMLFNFLLDNTVAQFSSKIVTGEVRAAINVAWEVFRDVSNIVIIGMFTFIAISLILGIKEYGERKMIARALIVAVLINFSLLFTKIIIDGSNFVAYQFHRAAQLETKGDPATASSDTPPPGVAGAFLNSMGATSVMQLFDVLKATQQSKDGYSLKTIVFGIVMGALLLLAAAVLLYGSFLMLARALLLIFLMITAPLAFASWLIPKFAQEGWHKWWDSLLKSAVFAPLLMLFLWVSLKLISGFQGDGALGELMSPETPGNLALGTDALFRYLIVLGFLFASIKIASKFSGTIAGFGTLMTAGVAPFALANRLAIAPLMRSTLGRVGARWEEGKKERLGSVRTGLATTVNEMRALEKIDKKKRTSEEQERLEQLQGKYKAGTREAVSLQRQADRFFRGGMAKSSFNVMNTSTGKTLAGTFGLKGTASGADKKPQGYADIVKQRAEEAAKATGGLVLGNADREKLQMQEEKKLRDMQRGTEDALKKGLAEATKVVAERQPEISDLERRHDDAKGKVKVVETEATKRKGDISRKYEGEMDKLRKQIADMRSSGGDATTFETALNDNARARDVEMQAEDERINSARAEVKSIQSRISLLKEPLTKAEKEYSDFNENITKETQKNVDALISGSREVAADIAGRKAFERSSNIIPRALGLSTVENDRMTKAARKETLKRTGAERQRAQLLTDLMKEAPSEGVKKDDGDKKAH